MHKNISSIQYNFLNLPTKITYSSGKSASYVYNGAGEKLRTSYKASASATAVPTDYCGNMIYEIKSTGNSLQRFRFNGKEFDRTHGLDWYDYGARHMTPDVGRFTTIDPMAEKYYNISPYAYCANNPVKYVDLHGDSILKQSGEPLGKHIQGNLGQTLYPNSGLKRSTNGNIQININGRGNINAQSIGIVHEFGHVILHLRRLPSGHRQSGVDSFVYGRASMMSKRLGYDY